MAFLRKYPLTTVSSSDTPFGKEARKSARRAPRVCVCMCLSLGQTAVVKSRGSHTPSSSSFLTRLLPTPSHCSERTYVRLRKFRSVNLEPCEASPRPPGRAVAPSLGPWAPQLGLARRTRDRAARSTRTIAATACPENPLVYP